MAFYLERIIIFATFAASMLTVAPRWGGRSSAAALRMYKLSQLRSSNAPQLILLIVKILEEY